MRRAVIVFVASLLWAGIAVGQEKNNDQVFYQSMKKILKEYKAGENGKALVQTIQLVEFLEKMQAKSVARKPQQSVKQGERAVAAAQNENGQTARSAKTQQVAVLDQNRPK